MCARPSAQCSYITVSLSPRAGRLEAADQAGQRRSVPAARAPPTPPLPLSLAPPQVHVSFESILDTESYTVRIPEAECEKLPVILQAYTQKQIAAMQRSVAKVWQR